MQKHIESVVLIPVGEYNKELAARVIRETKAMMLLSWAERTKKEVAALRAKADEFERQLIAKGFLPETPTKDAGTP